MISDLEKNKKTFNKKIMKNLEDNVKFRSFALMNGKELKELRKKFNLTQEDVAKGIEAQRTRISDWENERYKISNAYRILLQQFFSKYKD